MAPEPTAGRAGYLEVPLRGLSIASAAVALTCLAALAVVASIKNVDTLSTVALALAVVAFVAQLIVFVVQAGAANAQMVQSQQLHSQLLGLLSEMGERARGTEAAVTVINERLLEAALGKALRTGTGEESDARRVASEVASILNLPETETQASSTPGSRLIDPPAREAARRTFTTFPETSLPERIAELDRLSPQGRRALKFFGQDELSYAGTNLGVGRTLESIEGAPELLANSLVTQREDNSLVYQLTDAGRDAARILMAPGEPPAEIADDVARLTADL